MYCFAKFLVLVQKLEISSNSSYIFKEEMLYQLISLLTNLLVVLEEGISPKREMQILMLMLITRHLCLLTRICRVVKRLVLLIILPQCVSSGHKYYPHIRTSTSTASTSSSRTVYATYHLSTLPKLLSTPTESSSSSLLLLSYQVI